MSSGLDKPLNICFYLLSSPLLSTFPPLLLFWDGEVECFPTIIQFLSQTHLPSCKMAISRKLEWILSQGLLNKRVLVFCFDLKRCVCAGRGNCRVVYLVNNRIDRTPDNCPEHLSSQTQQRRVCVYVCVCLAAVSGGQQAGNLFPLPLCCRGSYCEGERREHYWKDLLASHSLDSEQVRSPSLSMCCSLFKARLVNLFRSTQFDLLNIYKT